MKILVLSDRIPPENAGGAEKVAWSFALGLRDLGHDVHILSGTSGNPFGETRDGIPTTHIHARWPVRTHAYFTLYYPGVAKQVAKVYEQVRPDVIAAFNVHNALTYHSLTLAHRRRIPSLAYFQDVMSVAYGKLTHFVSPSPDTYTADAMRLPRFYNLRFARFRYNPFRNPRIRHVLKQHATTLVATSKALQTALTVNGIPVPRVIYPGIAEARWQAGPDDLQRLKSRLGLAGKPVIVFAGRLSIHKGSVQVLNALRRVREKIPEVRLLLLTRSTLEQQGVMKPEFADLQSNIVTGGWLEGAELAAAYRAADVITTPSVCLDSMSGINLEAMVCRKPVVTSYLGGSPEAVIDGVTGYVVNPFDSEAYADRLMRLLNDREHAQTLGEAGYQRYKAHFVLSDRAAELADHLAEAVAGRR